MKKKRLAAVATLVLVVATLVLPGCSTTIWPMRQCPGGSCGGAPTAKAPPGSWLEALLEGGAIPLNVEVRDGASLDVVPRVRVRAWDDTLEAYVAQTGDDGVARFQVPTVWLPRWELNLEDGRGWAPVPGPTITPLKSGLGLRAVVLIPAPPLKPGPQEE